MKAILNQNEKNKNSNFVIRLEGSNGTGPWGDPLFTRSEIYRRISRRHNPRNGFPGPNGDQGINDVFDFDFYFAYNNIYDFNRAFKKDELEYFIKCLNYKVFILELNNMVQSKYQTIFKKEYIISKNDISHIFLTN